MPLFIHSADIHLRKDRPDRIEVFKHFVEEARKKSADILLCGDLFDTVSDANALRAEIRTIQKDLAPQRMFLIPGNHDAEAYDESLDYGENIVVLRDKPFSFFETDGLRIVGLPFQHSVKLSEILSENIIPPSDILLAHATLFMYGHPELYLEVAEKKEEYFPIHTSDVFRLKTRYLALGHIHGGFFLKEIEGTTLCYPGSPLPVDASETGKRFYAEVDFQERKASVRSVPIDILPYIEKETFFMFIGNEIGGQVELRRILKERAHRQAKMFVDVKGYVGIPEYEMNEMIKTLNMELAPEYAELHISNKTTSYRHLLESNPLVREFVRRLDAAEEEPDVKRRALELALQAFDTLSKRR